MLTVKLICAGRMREKFYIEAYKEYVKRLAAFCKFEEAEINEVKTSDDASQKEIDQALSREADEILEKIPQEYGIKLRHYCKCCLKGHIERK